ncbi:MAG: T9SS type A sorting domain-containing protein [Fibrobacter sp.]|nr:T9SS type A sorting domain-containing protein [Fibrobacter sp.]
MKKALLLLLFVSFTIPVFAQTKNYRQLHDMLIKFYGYQRAGLKNGSANNLNPGFKDASHSGDSYGSTALDGGWYDAGDYIKFGMPLGYTVYCLLKGYDVFPSAYSDNYSWDYGAKDGIPDILNEVKYATDYINKAVISKDQIVLDVGKADEEHRTWGVVNGNGRSGDKIVLCSGADIPLTYAACLALMSTLYRKYDAKYADTCLENAKIAFEFGKKKYDAKNFFCNPQYKDGKPLYHYEDGDGIIEDRMVAAGIELYRATNDGDPIYKEYARKSISEFYNCMGYQFIGPLAAFEVWRQGLADAGALIANTGFIEGKVKKEGIFTDIYLNSGWGTAREAGSAAFEFALAYVTSSSTSMREKYLKRVTDHVNWVAGYKGNRSYVVGFNGSPATNIHYRSPGTPNGALVSGPDGNGNWSNDGTADFCEVAIDYNAGITGAVAFLLAMENPGNAVKVTTPFSATPKENANFETGTVSLKAAFSEPVKWIVKITGAFGSKTFSKTSNSIDEKWDGSADEGMFLSGETVRLSVAVEDKEIAVYDLVNLSGTSVYISQNKVPSPKSGDKIVDNFDDLDTANNINGKWIPIGTEAGASRTKLRFESDSDALTIAMSVKTNGPETFGGVKTTFNSDGTPVSIGPAKSILFDLRANKEAFIYVELEQSDITDSAYHSVKIPVMKNFSTYRLNISDFKQPDWKKSEVPLNLGKITALRFTNYDSTGMISYYLDNVYIEDLNIGGSSVVKYSPNGLNTTLKPVFSNGTLTYHNLPQLNGSMKLSIFNVAGKLVMQKQLGETGGTRTFSLSGLPSGMYTLIHSHNGNTVGDRIKLTHIQ